MSTWRDDYYDPEIGVDDYYSDRPTWTEAQLDAVEMTNDPHLTKVFSEQWQSFVRWRENPMRGSVSPF